MIACLCPNSSSADHTLNTLRYADRLKGKKLNMQYNYNQNLPSEESIQKKANYHEPQSNQNIAKIVDIYDNIEQPRMFSAPELNIPKRFADKNHKILPDQEPRP